MEKIKIKELVDFRKKATKAAKKNFAYKLKTRKEKIRVEKDISGGGDYWITSTSAIYNVYKYGDKTRYDLKIEELQEKYNNTELVQAKAMYKRNIDILGRFKDFDFKELKPISVLGYEKIPSHLKILSIDDFPLYITPNLLFSFKQKDIIELGALWLVPQIGGYQKSELGMFCEALYRFMEKNYSDKFQISQDFCIAIDTFSAQKVVFKELIDGDFPFLIRDTLALIKGS